MESAKHSLQDQLLLSSSSSSSSSSTTVLDSSSYAAATGSAHVCWTPNTILNSGTFGSHGNAGGALVNSRNPRLQNDILASSLDSSMTQDLSFDWTDSTGSTTFTNNPSSHHDLQLSQIKRELSDSYLKFSEMISSPSSTIEDMQNQPISCYAKKEHRDINDMNVKLLLRTLSPCGGQNSSGLQSCPEDFYCGSSTSPDPVPPHRGTFSQIYPTINVSNFSQTSLANSSSAFDMNLQALDLFHSARFGGSLRQSLQNQLDLSRSSLSYGLDYMKQSIQRPVASSNMTPFSSGVAEAKRCDVLLEPKAPQAAAKRSRLESRASCTPFKVRKEKLGDRIAALQQLVAPFGKTDTASVLMEAIGYIKFLQNQVETLSVPYLNSSSNKTQRAVQGGPAENGNEERKRDLRSRGLCLVPLSCLSYMTDSGGAVWPPPNFGGGT